MKLSKKQIDLIRANTPEKHKGKQTVIIDSLGYFTPAGANWSYRAGWAEIDGARVLVVTRFGEVM
jgi:hypothetical protein